ncbi:HutD/Ves family protein [Cupriavidus pampae]|uniref:Protein Ves n=1 Tax=Cupriavidus pampae TaxID=659251 RepID=A0ABN7Z2R9_9BURK|nr:HutD family protein [Cupriavidus pampae]CAG9178971.1 Protein Ves [Cupriavidus pampae]
MSVRRFSLDGIAPTPWKNGGGQTREIAAWPPGASMETFDWRISVADIAADGPFSAFVGIDRQIALLEGAGVVLQARDGTFRHRLDRLGEPFPFTGDIAVDATLIDGPTRDFNVMTRRGRCRAVVEALRSPIRIDGDDAMLMFVVAGRWHDADGHPLAAGDGMLWTAASMRRTTLTPADTTALCLRVTLHGEPI